MPSGLVYREAVKDLFVKDLQYTEYFLQPNMKFNATSVIFLCIGSLNLYPPSRLKMLRKVPKTNLWVGMVDLTHEAEEISLPILVKYVMWYFLVSV